MNKFVGGLTPKIFSQGVSLMRGVALSGGNDWRCVHGGQRIAETQRGTTHLRDLQHGAGTSRPGVALHDPSPSRRDDEAAHRNTHRPVRRRCPRRSAQLPIFSHRRSGDWDGEKWTTEAQRRNYRPRRPAMRVGAKGQGALCRREKEILALGRKMSPGRGACGVFCKGRAEFEGTPLVK